MNVRILKIITIGTNMPLTLSAREAIFGLVLVASTTKLTIFEIVESLPMFWAMYSMAPLIFRLPATTLLLASFLTGVDSPVIKDSST